MAALGAALCPDAVPCPPPPNPGLLPLVGNKSMDRSNEACTGLTTVHDALLCCREWSSDQAAVLHYTYNRFGCVPTSATCWPVVAKVTHGTALQRQMHASRVCLLCHHHPIPQAGTSSRGATAATARRPRRMPSAASSCRLTGARAHSRGGQGQSALASCLHALCSSMNHVALLRVKQDGVLGGVPAQRPRADGLVQVRLWGPRCLWAPCSLLHPVSTGLS